jgi:hypothetical protein
MHASNFVGVFCETGSVTHKKDAARLIVRTEEIITLNKLSYVFQSMTIFDQDNF